MTKQASLRSASYPHKSSLLTPGIQVARDGSPGTPYAWTDAGVLFKAIVTVPVTAASSNANFSALYPDHEFTYSATPWLRLLQWEGALSPVSGKSALLITEAWIVWGSQILPNTTLDAASLRARLTLFSSGYGTNSDDDLLEATTVVSAGSTAGLKFTPKDNRAILLNGGSGINDRRVLALQVRNTGGSPFVSGALGVVVRAMEV